MRGHIEGKLKWLVDRVPSGYLIDTRTLQRHGISRQLAHKYVESAWLESVVHGLYRRSDPAGSQLDWRVIVRSLQYLMDYDTAVGGRTSLELQGFGHYVPLGGELTVQLYGNNHPTWLTRLDGKPDFNLHGTGLFDVDTNTQIQVETPAGELQCSSPEQAILELLDELPKGEDFHVVDTIFEGLTAARPRRLEALLMSCTSIKVRRLFFVFADRHRHGWRKYVLPDAFDLGSGDRALVDGGRLHPKYRIVIPEEFMPDAETRNGDA